MICSSILEYFVAAYCWHFVLYFPFVHNNFNLCHELLEEGMVGSISLPDRNVCLVGRTYKGLRLSLNAHAPPGLAVNQPLLGYHGKIYKSLNYFVLFLHEYFWFLFGDLGESVPWYLVKNPQNGHKESKPNLCDLDQIKCSL
jgi:hypothetical protein